MPMKNLKSIILLVSAGTALLAGCTKQLFTRHNGDFVNFGAESHSSVQTKADYGNYYTDESQKYQAINWASTDEIRIYSPTSARRKEIEQGITDPAQLYHWADYSVIPNEDDPTKGNIQRMGEDGLVWVMDTDADKVHTFYAVYPRNRQGIAEDEGLGLGPEGANGEFPLYIPGRQSFSVKGNLSNYGYMTARTTAKYSDPEPKVSLDFYPAFTAFEISIRSAGEAIGLSEFKLHSAAEKIAGDYTVKYNANTGDRSFDCSTAEEYDLVVNLTGKSAPAAADNNDLVFTVLAVPQPYTNLSVSFTTSQGVTRTLQLKNTSGNITFAAGQKHRIYGLALPNGELLISVGTAPWVEGGDHTYTTIEDASTVFESYQAYVVGGGEPWSAPTYVAIAPGYSSTTDPETGVTTESPEYSPMFTLTTVSVGVQLQLISDNPKVGFYTTSGGIQSSLTIPASTITTEKPYGTENVTSYFVVPLDSAADGDIANISLIRLDSNTPIAYTHQNLPGTTDHTKVMFMVVTPDKYQNNTTHMTPDDN